MALDRPALLDLLAIVDKIEASGAITLVAVGDTAMTLLGLKPSTEYLDFTGPERDIAEFNRIRAASSVHGYQIKTWANGLVFGQQLPDDYQKNSIEIIGGLKRINLRALHPIDIVVSKIEKLSERDMQDIRVCIREFKLGKNQISKRARALQQVGNEAKFEANLDYVLGLFA